MTTRLFFSDFSQFGKQIALLSPMDNCSLTYDALEARVQERVADIGPDRGLIFIQGTNSPDTIINYLAALRTSSVFHLVEDIEAEKGRRLVDHYRPNKILIEDRIFVCDSNTPIIHPDLKLLLSTSGSTGSPKFVKLSVNNIQSNAEAIVKYLSLTQDDRAFCHLKPFYSFGLSIINSHLQCGASLVLSGASMMTDQFWKDLNSTEATSFSGVPYNFEMLHGMDIDLSGYKHLRYATQAGGKLRPELVTHFAETFGAVGKDFFVMYGQTEAAPRMSYLPTRDALSFPSSIGRAIPGGELFLIDEAGEPTELPEGELAYRGPNVMMGYTSDRSQLSSNETPDFLRTGDIGKRLPNGLFQIIGRKKRFVKLYGIRINLDSIEAILKAKFGQLVVIGNDEYIGVALASQESPSLRDQITKTLVNLVNIPHNVITLRFYDEMPLLPNGKVNYNDISQDFKSAQIRPFPQRFWDKLLDILGLSEHQFHSVEQAFLGILAESKIDESQSFESLGADSLAFVSLQIELEQLFDGDPPINWTSLSIASLDEVLTKRRKAL